VRDASLPPVVEPMRAEGLADSVHDLAERDPEFA
jgi:long-chain acyl-CoA synthetase